MPSRNTTTTDNLPPLCLHDALALGEVELGLANVVTATEKQREKSELEEIERLPVLLRLLEAARPSSSIPTFDDGNTKTDTNSNSNTEKYDDAEEDTHDTPIDEIANKVVARLEDVAATYSIAEGVDVVACHLAPAICLNVSKLSPLKRKRASISGVNVSENTNSNTNNNTAWDTGELVVVGAHPRSSFKRRRISSHNNKGTKQQHGDSADDIAAGFSEGFLSDDEENDKRGAAATTTEGTSLNARRLSRRSSSDHKEVGAEDSQEEVVSKTLSELSTLVASALEPVHLNFESSEREGGDARKGKLALTTEDSTLAEPVRRHSTTCARGVMTGSDLGSTVASLMHHAPVLRHQHVADALCRASVPQAADLIKRMGANCPSAVPSLLRGCIDAYKSSISGRPRYASISNMAKSAIHALADLSAREMSQVRTTLQQDGVLLDLQLLFAMRQDPMSAMCLILEHLSSDTLDIKGQAPSQASDAPFEVISKDSLNVANTEGGDKMSLKTLLRENQGLLSSTLVFLQDELKSSMEAPDVLYEGGRISLLLRCYAWLALHSDVTKPCCASDDGIQGFVPLLSVLQTALTKIQDAAGGATSVERALGLLLCGFVMTLSRLLSLDGPNKAVVDQCGLCVKECLDSRWKDAKYGILVARFLLALQHNDAELFRGLLNIILDPDLPSRASCIDKADNVETCVLKVGEWLQSSDYNVETILKECLSSASPADLSLMLDVMEYSQTDAESTTDSVRACLNDLLRQENQQAETEYLVRMPEFTVKATKYLAINSDRNLPIVSPLELEKLASKVNLRFSGDRVSTGGPEIQLLYQVLYWFAYIDSGSNSLFTFDARALPLKELVSFAFRRSNEFVGAKTLGGYLENLIVKHCPEIPKQRKRWELANHSTTDFTGTQELNQPKVRQRLSKALKTALSKSSVDPSGVVAERAFISARTHLSDSDIYPRIVSNLLGMPNSPPPFFTYGMLCNDPLVLLKAPMRIWQCAGLRRVVLSILTSLLETSEAILDRASPSTIGANELIACQHVLLVRCILVAISGSDDKKSDHAPFFCSVTSDFLRMLIAKNPGLVGMILKQSPTISERMLDWMVELVPETMDDTGSLINVLSERGSATTRLTASASILRIAIAHGHRNEEATERLVYAALAQLVSSFFLVIGPVGVPVNVLIGDASGMDVTQASRKATFRMLRSLVNVRGRMRPRMRNECGLALHKLAGLCKGENLLSGVAGAVLSRRKGLLREMFEAVNKAANQMGSGMEL